MGKLRDLAVKLKAATPAIQEAAILEIVRRNEAYGADLNIEQMMEGRNSVGQRIEPEYSELTVIIKKKKGQPYDRVTLHDEGDFQRGIFMEADKFPITLTSKDHKTAELVEKYGKEIFGLDTLHLQQFNQGYLKEDIIQYYRNLLHV